MGVTNGRFQRKITEMNEIGFENLSGIGNLQAEIGNRAEWFTSRFQIASFPPYLFF